MADKKELLRFCGSLEQAAGVRRIEYQDGRASGLRCALVQNGPLEFLLMLDLSLIHILPWSLRHTLNCFPSMARLR